jgi:hypothetical protein
VKILRYIELKSGHSDNGPAWIRTGKTHWRIKKPVAIGSWHLAKNKNKSKTLPLTYPG